jgi:ubiquinone/menaquinone biosynthesis C-methylase UbiE
MPDETDVPRTAYTGTNAYRYDEHRFTTGQGRLFAQLELRELRRAIKVVGDSGRVLEVGCGTGRFSEYLGRRGMLVTATDPSPDMLEITRRKCSTLDNVEVRQAEGASLPFPGDSFDFVFAIRVLNQTESKGYAKRVIREMVRVARPGGRVLVEYSNADRPFARPKPTVRLTFGEVSKIASSTACQVEQCGGVAIFSQSVIQRVPTRVLPLWGLIERAASRVLWRWASRCYVLLRKDFA